MTAKEPGNLSTGTSCVQLSSYKKIFSSVECESSPKKHKGTKLARPICLLPAAHQMWTWVAWNMNPVDAETMQNGKRALPKYLTGIPSEQQQRNYFKKP